MLPLGLLGDLVFRLCTNGQLCPFLHFCFVHRNDEEGVSNCTCLSGICVFSQNRHSLSANFAMVSVSHSSWRLEALVSVICSCPNFLSHHDWWNKVLWMTAFDSILCCGPPRTWRLLELLKWYFLPAMNVSFLSMTLKKNR